MPDADVIIVGGGPVGMGLAIELGQRGITAIVVERYRDIQPIPKGQNLTQRTMEHFHCWGVEDDVRRRAPLPKELGIGGLTAYRTLISDYYYDWYQRAILKAYYFRENERLPQYDTEKALRQRVAGLQPVQVLYDHTADEIAQDTDGVAVGIVARGSGERRTLRGRYAVGCDGSRSVVRTAAGITQTRSHHDMLMVLLVFHSDTLDSLMPHYRGKSFFNVLHPDLEGYWLFFGRVDAARSWFFHAPVPAGTAKDNFDFTAMLHKAVGAQFDCEIEHTGFWDLRFATADSYRNGRLLIAGDAAHSHPPYGGFGVNTGLEDARNLGWKLAATLQGWGGEALLDSYTAERRPVFASTAKDFIQTFIDADNAFLSRYDPERDKAAFEAAWARRKSGTTDEIHSYEPHYEGSSIVAGPKDGVSGARGVHAFKARAGHHLAPQPLSSGRNVFEELGNGFTLLALGVGEEAIASFGAAAGGLGIPLKIVRDTYADGREAYESRLILIRPDHYVGWCADEMPANPESILSMLTATG
ncbi:MAG: FAD-dependent oxidoreductase [Hyphomicrobiaceae bacterium]